MSRAKTRFHDNLLKLPEIYHSPHCKFLVIAHRGASHYSPENTMAAFRLALEMGADMIELDVLLSSDGIPVVIHDNELERLAGIKEKVSQLPFDRLRDLDAGSWFNTRFKNEKIPSLEEVLTWAKDKIALNIEIKSEAVSESAGKGVEEQVIGLVKKYGMENHILLSSFNTAAVKRFKMLAPEISSGYLYTEEASGGKSAAELMKIFQSDIFHIDKWKLKKKHLSELNKAGYPVMVYTVNGKRKMRSLIRKGVYGIFSDRPDQLRQVADSEIEGRCR